MLRDDHESGAQALALLALEMLLSAVKGNDLSNLVDTEEFWKELRLIAWHLAKNGRPSMGAAIEAAVFKALKQVKDHLEREYPGPEGVSSLKLQTFKDIAESAIRDKIDARAHSLEALADHFTKYVLETERKDATTTTIVTLSSSGTVKECLKKLILSLAKGGKNTKLCILESRPKFEGIALANGVMDALEKDGKGDLEDIKNRLKVEGPSDASVSRGGKEADYLVLGADKVLSNGDVSNKIGSLTTAIVTKTLNPGCRVIAVFETDKITGAGEKTEHLKVEYNKSTEVTDTWPQPMTSAFKEKMLRGFSVEVKNAYFEWVPARYIDQYISEEGSLAAKDIARLSTESDKLEQRLFEGV